MAITHVQHNKKGGFSLKIPNFQKKNLKKKLGEGIFFFKITKWGDFNEMVPETKSRNSGDHEF